MLASFVNGPLDQTEREVEIPFAVIEIFWQEGMDPATVPLFLAVPGADEIWQYSLETTDYETRAVYWGTKVGGNVEVEIQRETWTAAGQHFDVYYDGFDETALVEIDGDEIYFPEYDITVRVAQRQGE